MLTKFRSNKSLSIPINNKNSHLEDCDCVELSTTSTVVLI